MDQELFTYQSVFAQKSIIIGDLHLKLRAKTFVAEEESRRAKKAKSGLDSISKDLSQLWECFDNHKKLKDASVALYRKYSSMGNKNQQSDPMAAKIKSSFQLEKTVGALTSKLEKERENKDLEYDRILHENSMLLW